MNPPKELNLYRKINKTPKNKHSRELNKKTRKNCKKKKNNFS